MEKIRKERRDRRVRRAHDVARALQFQLDSCRTGGRLDAMVVSDDTGLCLAATGERETCEEIAAGLPMLGQKAGDFDGVLLWNGGGGTVKVRRFRVAESELYVCAVGGEDRRARYELARSISGVTRILAA